MAKRLVEFPLAGGGTVLVQAADGAADGGHDGGEVTRGWGDRDEITVDVGIEPSADVRASVAGASSTGDFTASMTWRPGRTAGQAPAPAESGRGDPTTGVP
jgi:hypothetical protein